jgi:manganese-dependent inorganic pyrophosphatase
LQALESLKNEKHIDSAMLLVTDVIHGNSKLIITDWPKIEENLIYKKESSGLYDLPGILSRKKQLLPEILRCLA